MTSAGGLIYVFGGVGRGLCEKQDERRIATETKENKVSGKETVREARTD
jgi:hypothetical protein